MARSTRERFGDVVLKVAVYGVGCFAAVAFVGIVVSLLLTVYALAVGDWGWK